MLAAGSGFAGAQTRLDLRTQTKTPDLSALGATSTFQTGATLPATCTSGQSYFLTLAEPGANLFLCASANTWSQIKSAVAGGVRSVTGANDTLQRTDDKMNVIYTGSGAVAVTLPQPGTGGGPGSVWEASVFNSSTNGTLTLTPVGTGIDGYSSVSVPPLQGLSIWSDGTTYHSGSTILQAGTGIQLINRKISSDTSVMLSTADYQDGTGLRCFSNSGLATAFTCTTPTLFSAYANGMRVNWQPDVACDAAPTLSINGLPAVAIAETGGASLKTGDCDTPRKNLTLAYNSALAGGPYWEIVGGGTVPGANAGLPATLAQTNTSNRFSTGTQDFSSAQHTLPTVTGTQALLPAACTLGELYFASDVPAGQNLFYCTATNVWRQQSGASGTKRGSMHFSTLGYNGAGLGPYINWVNSSTSIGGNLAAGTFPFAGFGNGSNPTASYNFVWPADFDASGRVDVTLGFADGSYSGGNAKFDVSIACVAANTGLGAAPIFGTSATTGTVAVGGGDTLITSVISAVDTVVPSCSPDELASLKIMRDTSISGQAGMLQMIRVSLTYSRLL